MGVQISEDYFILMIKLKIFNLVNFTNLKELQDYLNRYLFFLSLFQEIIKKQNFQKSKIFCKIRKKKNYLLIMLLVIVHI